MSDLGKRPVERQPDKLGAAFGSPPRRGSAAAALGAPPPAPAPVRVVEQEPDPEPQPVKIVPAKPAATKPKPPKKASRSKPVSRMRPVTTAIYLPVSVRDRLKTAADQRGLTYTDVLLDAIDAVHDRLDELLGDDRQRPSHSLFRGRRRRTRQRRDEDQVQVTVRPTRDDLATIDSLVSQHSATSRSGMATTVLDAYLP